MFFTSIKLSLPVFFIILCRSISPPGWNTSYLTFFYNASLLMLNSFSFCMSEKNIHLPSFLKDIFTEYGILGDKFLYFSTLTCLSFFKFLSASKTFITVFFLRGGAEFHYHVPWCSFLPSSLPVFFLLLFLPFLLPSSFLLLCVFGFFWASWICRFTAFIKLGKLFL